MDVVASVMKASRKGDMGVDENISLSMKENIYGEEIRSRALYEEETGA